MVKPSHPTQPPAPGRQQAGPPKQPLLMELSLLPGQVEGYLQALLPPRPPAVADMERLAEREDFPIIGPQVGRVLHLLASVTGARRILELGSGYGYSAYWFASAMPPEGRVICTEGGAGNIARGKDFLSRAGVIDRVEFHQGNALDIIDRVDGDFDIIFNDIDKGDYPAAARKAVPRLRPGGLFVSDNVLWSGKVAAPAPGDAWTRAIVEFNEHLMGHPDLHTTILPVRDGLLVAWKRPKAAKPAPAPAGRADRRR